MTTFILTATVVIFAAMLWRERRRTILAQRNADIWCERCDDFRRQTTVLRAERSALRDKLNIMVEDAQRIEAMLNHRIQVMKARAGEVVADV